MDVKPAAFVAAAAVVAGAAGIGAYLAVRDNTAPGATAEPDVTMAMASTGVAMPVDATEQVVALSAPEQPAPALEPEAVDADPPPRVAERRAAPPPPAPTPPPAPDPEPEPEPEPEAEPELEPEPGSEPEPDAEPSEAGDPVDDLPPIDGWRRVERPADTTAPDEPAATEATAASPSPVAVDADGWPVAPNAEATAGSAAGADTGVQSPRTPALPGPAASGEWVLAADSVIGLQIDTPVSSDTADVEDDVQARVTRDVIEQDRVVIPAGTVVMGSVVLVEQAGQFRGTARLGVRFHTIVFGDGMETPILTETVYREGESQGKQNAAKVGGGAIAGAILGAIFGGGRGAAIGGAAGASAGTAAAATGDAEPATLMAGATLTVRLSRPAILASEP